jgi:putative peptidoglycan lipid II flippase
MVRRALSLVYTEIRGLHQAASLLALFAVGSQLLAVVRDRLLAHTFGAGVELDVYYAAFRIPDVLYVLLVSVLSVYVLLPFVDRARAEHGEPAAARVLSHCFSVFLYAYVVLVAALWVLVPSMLPVLFPGFADAAAYDTLTTLTRIMLLQPFLLGLSTLVGVITQAERRFVLYACAPLLYNLGIIVGVTVFYPLWGLSGLAGGVILGAAAHFAIQYPAAAASSLRFSYVWPTDWGLIGTILRAALPRALALSAHQVSLLILMSMATTLTVGSVAVFQLAFNLQSVPLAVVGMSYSVAAFPLLSAYMANDDRHNFNLHVLTALRHIIFWALPIAGLIIVLRAQLVRVLFGSGGFDWDDTRLTAAVLALLVVSLVAQALLLLLVRAQYAAGRPFTPLWVALAGVFVTIGCTVGGLQLFATSEGFRMALETTLRVTGVPGTEVLVLALGFSVGMLVEVLLLLVVSVSLFGLRGSSLLRPTGEALLAAVGGGMATYLTLNFVVDGINQQTFVGMLLQGMVAGTVGLSVVVLLYYVVGSSELRELIRSWKARFFQSTMVAPQVDNPS